MPDYISPPTTLPPGSVVWGYLRDSGGDARNKAYLGVGIRDELEIPDHHLAAIDLATWQAVQRLSEGSIRSGNVGHIHHPRRLAVPSLLSGLAVCAHCGSALSYDITNRNKSNAWPFYICGKKTRQGWKSCEGRMVNARLADQAILDALMNRVLTLDFSLISRKKMFWE